MHSWRLALSAMMASMVVAGASGAAPNIVIGNDRGGAIQPRAERIRALNQSGTRVEIRGDVCLSSCTMFLGAKEVCVLPGTRFGFHGPSSNGRPLPSDRFDYWSDVIARHYPAPLRAWFMETARHRRTGYFTLTGARLIELGVPPCQTRGR